jgi:hypothetical protein
MPVTNIQVTKNHAVANEWEICGFFTVGPYTQGGVPFIDRDFRVDKVRNMEIPSALWDGTTLRIVTIDWTNRRFYVFLPTGEEAPEGTLLPAISFTVRGSGQSATFVDP